MPCSGLVLWLGASLTGGLFSCPVLACGSLAGGFFRVLFRFSCSGLERENLHLLAAGNGYVPSRDRWSRPKKETRAGQACAKHRSSELETHCVQGGFNTHQGAELCITPRWTPFQGITHQRRNYTSPQPQSRRWRWILLVVAETSKLSETSRTPLFSARTPAI